MFLPEYITSLLTIISVSIAIILTVIMMFRLKMLRTSECNVKVVLDSDEPR
jgi:hypothetical protein